MIKCDYSVDQFAVRVKIIILISKFNIIYSITFEDAHKPERGKSLYGK
jgi:hypothetical protein